MIAKFKSASITHRSLLHEHVMRLIARHIIRAANGNRPAVVFTEAELCRTHNVSRTVVREAIKILATKGLVEIRPKRGIRSNPKSQWHLSDPHVLAWLSEMKPNHRLIRELCEVRQALEPTAAELAALRATDAEAQEVMNWYRRMEKATHQSRRFIDADLSFHNAILVACHNDLLYEMISKLRWAFRASIAVTFKVPGGLDPALDLHQRVAEAIAHHDGPLARASMEELLGKTVGDITALLRSADDSSNIYPS